MSDITFVRCRDEDKATANMFFLFASEAEHEENHNRYPFDAYMMWASTSSGVCRPETFVYWGSR